MIKFNPYRLLLIGVACIANSACPLAGPKQSSGIKTEPRVLVLNSYHPQFEWTDRLVDGIREGLNGIVADEDLHIEYMDSRRFAGDTSHTDLLLPLYRAKYSRYPPDVIISTDDIALQFLLRHGAELFPGVPVVFCGVNDFSPEMLAGNDNFTGILEGTEVRGNIDLILALHPMTKRVVMLSDSTPLGIQVAQEAHRMVAEHSTSSNKSRFELILWNNFTLSELKQRAANALPGTVFLMLAVSQDREGRYFSYAKDLPDLAATSAVPIYGMWGALLLGRGVLGGLMNNPETHGEETALLVRRILEGEAASEIPIVPKARYEPAFDYAQMQRFGIAVDQIPPGSRVLGLPTNSNAISPWIVWTMAAVIVGLSMSTLFLLDHRRQLRRLHASTQFLGSIVESSAEAIIGFDTDEIVVSWNPAAETITGYTASEMIGHSLRKVVVPTQTQEDAKVGTREGRVMKIVGQVEHKAGTLVDVAVTISPLYDAAGDLVGACGVARDITEELQAQRDLFAATRRALEAEKLASIATLAAGIAHDIGAPMTAILGYAQMMQNSLPDEKNRRRAGIIVEQLNRITELVQALLNMSRPSQTVSVEVDLASVIDKSLELYHEMLRSRGIKVQRSFARVPAVAGDPNRLQQACLTLIANAADAMKDGGQLSLELSCANAGFVEIRIVDSGVGIAPEHLNRIFEPFYTTKEHGQGTGLGLLVAKGIVEEHTGRISVESTPDHGTTFTISLPVIET